ncbi:hypothetical protein L227DRAFT_568754 [Lentinus tigrinus ALCF2SS1-6]|uniref:Uncharacterized protein n=1 Tax=Lentinus tigrinus ALCF2SS1-6 TaxID=1328759 RepID=A0A5C2RNZ6_9APHY|nr:hypothetical protein L227DRAFT_568754 [Lentinus tigrinus ALCF2SS1-6]
MPLTNSNSKPVAVLSSTTPPPREPIHQAIPGPSLKVKCSSLAREATAEYNRTLLNVQMTLSFNQKHLDMMNRITEETLNDMLNQLRSMKKDYHVNLWILFILVHSWESIHLQLPEKLLQIGEASPSRRMLAGERHNMSEHREVDDTSEYDRKGKIAISKAAGSLCTSTWLLGPSLAVGKGICQLFLQENSMSSQPVWDGFMSMRCRASTDRPRLAMSISRHPAPHRHDHFCRFPHALPCHLKLNFDFAVYMYIELASASMCHQRSHPSAASRSVVFQYFWGDSEGWAMPGCRHTLRSPSASEQERRRRLQPGRASARATPFPDIFYAALHIPTAAIAVSLGAGRDASAFSKLVTLRRHTHQGRQFVPQPVFNDPGDLLPVCPLTPEPATYIPQDSSPGLVGFSGPTDTIRSTVQPLSPPCTTNTLLYELCAHRGDAVDLVVIWSVREHRPGTCAHHGQELVQARGVSEVPLEADKAARALQPEAPVYAVTAVRLCVGAGRSGVGRLLFWADRSTDL